MTIQYKSLVCGGPKATIWIGVSFGYLFLTQIVAVFLAFRTRKVQIKVLNDSKYLTVIIYISTVIITSMMIGAIALKDYLNADAAVFGALIIIFTTLVLGLMFIPKVKIILHNPQGCRYFKCKSPPSKKKRKEV